MKKNLNFTKALLLGAAALFITNIMFAQSLLWEKRYATTGTQDVGIAVHVDGSGNVYTAGSARTSSSDDMILIKYNGSGTQQWVVNYNGSANGRDEGYAIAQDASGYIYVAGTSVQTGQGNDITLIKYNTAGAQQWVQTYSSTGYDAAYDIAINGSNYIYVAGLYNNDAILLRYNTAGALQWAYTYNGTASGLDWFYDIELAPGSNDPNIYLAGVVTMGNSAHDALTVKVNSAGSVQWSRTFNGAGNAQDEGYKIKVDRDEYSYVAGFTTGTSSSYQNGLVLKYNTAGTLQWSATYDGTAYTASTETDQFFSVDLSSTTAANPDIYVTGTVTQGSVNNDYVTCKYNSSGGLVWNITYDGNASNTVSSDDQAYAVVRSANTGKIFVTGLSENTNQELNIVTIRYNPSTGGQEWVGNYNHTVNLTDQPTIYHPLALKYDGCHETDFIYVTGSSEAAANDADIVTLKYGNTGPCTAGSEGRFALAEEYNVPINYGLYPNPFTDFATLRINSETEITNGTLTVYNLFGSVVSAVENISSNQIIIERGNMPSGIYIYRFNSNGNSIVTGKMLIQ